MTKRFRKHLWIPDTQVRPGVKIDHLRHIGHYIVDKQPEVVIQGGDWWDMPSLSSYDRGKKSAEGRRYIDDIDAGNRGMDALMKPIVDYNRTRRNKYKPKLVILRGNHEARIERAVEDDPKLYGTLGYHQFNDVAYGWKPVPFLQSAVIDGIQYCHFFPRSASGRVMQNRNGAPNAATQVRREMMSSTAGHLQGLDYAIYQAGKRRVHGLLAGACYQHSEKYLTPQGNDYWRGVVMKHQVCNGDYDAMFVRLDYLRRKYG